MTRYLTVLEVLRLHALVIEQTRSKSNFWNVYRKLVRRWYVFYNAGENFQEVAVERAKTTK